MKVQVSVFPIAGLCSQKQEMELALEEGSMGELETLLFNRLGVKFRKAEALMLMLNGRGLDIHEEVVFCDGDQLWLLPQISGG